MRYFTIEELIRSEKAMKNRLRNKTTPEIEDNLRTLIVNLLDPLRNRFGSRIIVTSGYRCPRLNDMVGGTPNSQHLLGCAADLVAGSREDNLRLFNMIKDEFEFDQLIDEFEFTWVHVSYVHKNCRHIVLHKHNTAFKGDIIV